MITINIFVAAISDRATISVVVLHVDNGSDGDNDDEEDDYECNGRDGCDGKEEYVTNGLVTKSTMVLT